MQKTQGGKQQLNETNMNNWLESIGIHVDHQDVKIFDLCQGSYLWHEGSEANEVYIIWDGFVNIAQYLEESVESIGLFGHKDILSAKTLLSIDCQKSKHCFRNTHAKAFRKSRIIEVCSQYFHNLFEADRSFRTHVVQQICNHLDAVQAKYNFSKFSKLRSRIILEILILAKRFGYTSIENELVIPIQNLTKCELKKMLSIGHTSTINMTKELEEQGLILFPNGTREMVIIPDYEKLAYEIGGIHEASRVLQMFGSDCVQLNMAIW